MTPEEVFAQMRDIHVPAGGETMAWALLDPRPLAALGVIAIVVTVLPAVRRWLERRRLRTRLTDLAGLAPAEQRDALTELVQTLPRRPVRGAVPPAFYQPPEEIGRPEIETIRRWVVERTR